MQDSLRRLGAAAVFGAALVCAAPSAEAIQCAIFARSVTGLDLSGDAWQWWSHASGTYTRGNAPKPGAVLVFMRSAPMHHGHVSVVRQVVNNREILVDHANWGTRGAVSRGVPVVDDSPANDWSSVRVAFGGGYGRTNPTYGFIYGTAATAKELVEASARSDDAANQTAGDRDQAAEAAPDARVRHNHGWIKLAILHRGSMHEAHGRASAGQSAARSASGHAGSGHSAAGRSDVRHVSLQVAERDQHGRSGLAAGASAASLSPRHLASRQSSGKGGHPVASSGSTHGASHPASHPAGATRVLTSASSSRRGGHSHA